MLNARRRIRKTEKMDASESFCSSSSTHRRRYFSKSCRPLNTALVVACGTIKISQVTFIIWYTVKINGSDNYYYYFNEMPKLDNRIMNTIKGPVARKRIRRLPR